jgi:methanogenic corrinoid protein MtbC1
MPSPTDSPAPAASDDRAEELPRIADVERATGVPRATLRIWERRYGFPNPQRDARGERYYLPEEIERLRLVGALVTRGHRPGGLIPQPVEALQSLLAAPSESRFADEPLVRLLTGQDPAAVQHFLLQQLATLGLERFVCERMAASNRLVGDAWAAGELQVHEEHVYTEAVQQVVRSALAALPPLPVTGAPRVLLATLAHEQHGLGLLMAEAVLRLEGCPCISLGVNVPLDQLVRAAGAYRAEVLALSLSGSTRGREAVAQLRELRRRLPQVALWIGGDGSGFPLEPGLHITRFDRVDALKQGVQDYSRPAPAVS